ncbi:S1 RNA-binding domain-containing protein, partial [Micrococcus luteus]|nr:S1 RNA-binding domain-containing protein [Micrococcus luteus]
AFVDIGVGQDGLVHISCLSNKYVTDPREVVRVGQTVKVKVLEVEVDRNRINLSMRLDDDIGSSNRTARSDSRNNERRDNRS